MNLFVEKRKKCSFLFFFCPRCPLFPPDLQLTRALFSDKVSQLPREKSNYESCYILGDMRSEQHGTQKAGISGLGSVSD